MNGVKTVSYRPGVTYPLKNLASPSSARVYLQGSLCLSLSSHYSTTVESFCCDLQQRSDLFLMRSDSCSVVKRCIEIHFPSPVFHTSVLLEGPANRV